MRQLRDRLANRSCQVAILIALLCLGPGARPAPFAVPNPYATSASTADITVRKAFVFGDSYSRAARASFHNWIEQLRYELLNRNTKLPEVRSLIDQAAGAATGGNYPGSINDFAHQVTTWLAVKRTFDPRDITMVYFGYNDLNRTTVNTGVSLAQAASDYQAQLQRLDQCGGGRWWPAYPADPAARLGPYPVLQDFYGQSAEIRQQTILWNDMLTKMAQQSSYNLVAVDLFTAMECVFNHPADFGFTNVSDSLPAGANPQKYLYGPDQYHFAARGQTLIRQVVQYYLTAGWDWANTIKDPTTARQKLVAALEAGKVFPVKCTSSAPAPAS